MDFTLLVDEIARLCERVDTHEYGRMQVRTYRDDLARLRDIGALLDEHGGYSVMLAAAHKASRLYRNCGNTLNALWSGIGEWQC